MLHRVRSALFVAAMLGDVCPSRMTCLGGDVCGDISRGVHASRLGLIRVFCAHVCSRRGFDNSVHLGAFRSIGLVSHRRRYLTSRAWWTGFLAFFSPALCLPFLCESVRGCCLYGAGGVRCVRRR